MYFFTNFVTHGVQMNRNIQRGNWTVSIQFCLYSVYANFSVVVRSTLLRPENDVHVDLPKNYFASHLPERDNTAGNDKTRAAVLSARVSPVSNLRSHTWNEFEYFTTQLLFRSRQWSLLSGSKTNELAVMAYCGTGWTTLERRSTVSSNLCMIAPSENYLIGEEAQCDTVIEPWSKIDCWISY